MKWCVVFHRNRRRASVTTRKYMSLGPPPPVPSELLERYVRAVARGSTNKVDSPPPAGTLLITGRTVHDAPDMQVQEYNQNAQRRHTKDGPPSTHAPRKHANRAAVKRAREEEEVRPSENAVAQQDAGDTLLVTDGNTIRISDAWLRLFAETEEKKEAEKKEKADLQAAFDIRPVEIYSRDTEGLKMYGTAGWEGLRSQECLLDARMHSAVEKALRVYRKAGCVPVYPPTAARNEWRVPQQQQQQQTQRE